MNRVLTHVLCAIAWLLSPLAVQANEDGVVEARLPSGKVVTAAFHAGKDGLPAVLVLHGFLQTRDFQTVASVRGALTTAGYTVLVPTLSLGISGRNRSLPCEALHLHSLDDDVDEVDYWVKWLARKGHPRVILVGHSFGNLQLLTYLGRTPSRGVTKLVMVSLTDVEVKLDARQRAERVRALKERVARNDRTLAEAEFGHCRKYVAPPAALLSYMSLSRQSILDSLARSHVPLLAIMGSKDERMGPDWVGTLKAHGIDVRVVPGATHFFDNQYEFDLHEALLESLAAP